MAQLTQRQAAQQWGIPWTTFRRAVSSGKVSVGEGKKVDTAEMLRVFGEPKAQQNGPNGPTDLGLENARLRAENEALLELVRRADAERDRALDTVQRLLTHDGAPRRRWWRFGR